MEHTVLNTIRQSEERVDGCALELLALWSQSVTGTGSQPRTWHSLLLAVENVIGHREIERMETKMQTLSPSAFDENCQKMVSIHVYSIYLSNTT